MVKHKNRRKRLANRLRAKGFSEAEIKVAAWQN
jgi:hypothetical protein